MAPWEGYSGIGSPAVTLRTHHDYTVASGRADNVDNRLVIEYKRPGSLSKYPGSRSDAAAIEQTRSYVEDIETSECLNDARRVGVVTDAQWMIYCRHVADCLPITRPVRAFKALRRRLPNVNARDLRAIKNAI